MVSVLVIAPFIWELSSVGCGVVDDDVDVVLFVEICCTFETYTVHEPPPLYAKFLLYRSAWLSMKYDLSFALPLLDRVVKLQAALTMTRPHCQLNKP